MRGEEEARLVREEEERRVRHEMRRGLEEERVAKEAEERRIRHEKKRAAYEAEKAARRLEIAAAEQVLRDEEEAKRLRRQRRAEREAEKLAEAARLAEEEKALRRLKREAARRLAEEEVELEIPIPQTRPRGLSRRLTGASESKNRKDAPQPVPRRNSIFSGGLFSRSKTEPVVPTSKSVKPISKVRTDPIETLRKEDRPSSGHQSSNDSRGKTERPHEGSRRHPRREFSSAKEEAEYRAKKEERRAARAAKDREMEMSGGRDGGISLASPMDGAPPPPPEPREPPPPPPVPEPLNPPPPIPRSDPEPAVVDNIAMVRMGSISSNDRHRERPRRSRRVSAVEDSRPKIRRPSVTEKDRPTSRREDSDRPRTRDRGEENPRPRRSDVEKSGRKKKEEGGLKGFFGGLKKKL